MFQMSRLRVCQRAMERSILNVKLTDRIRNTILRSRTQIADVAHKAARLKWDWAGHVCRMPLQLWARIAQEWSPETARRGRGRPRRRWRDALDAFHANYREEVQHRQKWKEWPLLRSGTVKAIKKKKKTCFNISTYRCKIWVPHQTARMRSHGCRYH